MKKSTLLSLATAGAIVATSMGTFAAWDTMSVSTSGTVTLRNPITIEAPAMLAATETANYGETPTYESKAEFTVTNAPTTGYKLTPSVVVKNGENTVTDADVTVAVLDDKESAADVNGVHKVTITMTPKDTVAAKTLAGQELTVEVTGTIVADTK